VAIVLLAGAIPSRAASATVTVPIFEAATIHFSADSAGFYAGPGQTAEEQGRVLVSETALPVLVGPARITALVTIRPIPRDERTVRDRWDRAGNVRLAVEGAPDLEIVRFITAYGGRTDHEIDVSELAPLLRDARRFRAFVDTWVSPGWNVDFALRFAPDTTYDPPVWAAPVYYNDSFRHDTVIEPRHNEMSGCATTEVDVPPGLARVVMRYFSTGHCTDGRDADEFISKANVISVDGVVVARVHPWRDDCRRFRERNPYCARWTDGSWSSDYSRSGWCPGDAVEPMEFDLTDHLTAGRHAIKFVIEDMRPEDAQGNFGYWRVSASVIGWDHAPQLWRN
jgi:hypothetical protein